LILPYLTGFCKFDRPTTFGHRQDRTNAGRVKQLARSTGT
jgi:hypothetical protein